MTTLSLYYSLKPLIPRRLQIMIRRGIAWIADRGGMALLNTHPDYMRFDGAGCALEEFPVGLYAALLAYIQDRYGGQYWQPLAGEMARFWKERHARTKVPR